MEKPALSPRAFDQMSFLEMKAYYNEELRLNEAVNAELEQSLTARQKEIRLVVLGPRNSGKTAISKLFATVFGRGVNDHTDPQVLKRPLRAQVFDSIRALFEYANENGINLPSAANNFPEDVLKKAAEQESPRTSELAKLLASAEVKDAFLNFRSSKNGAADNLDYYSQHLERLAGQKFHPSDQDWVFLKESDTAVKDYSGSTAGYDILLTDIGTQNSISRRLLTPFEDVHGLVFVVSLADYVFDSDQSDCNSKLAESFKMFRNIVTSPSFIRKPIALVLNKRDIFERLLAQIPFNTMFDDYTGENSADQVIQYVLEQFQNVLSSRPLSPGADTMRNTLAASVTDQNSSVAHFLSDFAKSIHHHSRSKSPRS